MWKAIKLNLTVNSIGEYLCEIEETSFFKPATHRSDAYPQIKTDCSSLAEATVGKVRGQQLRYSTISKIKNELISRIHKDPGWSPNYEVREDSNCMGKMSEGCELADYRRGDPNDRRQCGDAQSGHTQTKTKRQPSTTTEEAKIRKLDGARRWACGDNRTSGALGGNIIQNVTVILGSSFTLFLLN